jgi:hypothetical protein
MGSAKTDNVARQKFKKRFIAWGMDPEEIELCMKQIKERQRAKNLKQIPIDAPLCTRASYIRLLKKTTGASPASTPQLRFGDGYTSPDDSKYKPAKVDSALNGVARVTGETAKAVKRRKTITKYEYDQRTKES